MRSSILIGALAALSHTASGLVFRDKISQEVDGEKLYVLSPTYFRWTVKLRPSKSSNLQLQGWKFDTEGLPDDEAVITPLDSQNSEKALYCQPGNECYLSRGERKPFRLARPDSTSHVFTIQDVESGLYVCRSSDLYLTLSDTVSDPCQFTLEKI